MVAVYSSPCSQGYRPHSRRKTASPKYLKYHLYQGVASSARKIALRVSDTAQAIYIWLTTSYLTIGIKKSTKNNSNNPKTKTKRRKMKLWRRSRSSTLLGTYLKSKSSSAAAHSARFGALSA